MKVNVLVAQRHLTLSDPMDCGPQGSTVHGILQVKILEWVVIPLSRGYSQARDRTQVSCIEGTFFTKYLNHEGRPNVSIHMNKLVNMFSVCEYVPILENLGLLCMYMCVSCILVNL